MAYEALVSLAESLDGILVHYLHCIAPDLHCREPNLHHIFLPKKQQIQSLRGNIISLSTFLQDFPREAGRLEARIALAANQADDIFRNVNGSEYGPPRCCNVFRKVILCPQSFGGHEWKRKRFCRRLEKVTKEIDSILKEVMQIKSSTSKNVMSTHSSASFASRFERNGKDNVVEFEEDTTEIKVRLCAEPSKLGNSTSEPLMSRHSSVSFSSRLAPNGNDIVVGFDEDLMKIKGRLCGEPSKLQIIPIVGMGGIGKTTLARYAHDDPLSVQHFDVRAWVTISQNSSMRKILFGLLRSNNAISERQYEESFDEEMVQRVYKYLKGRRYLVVMDDMWSTNVWDDVRRVFPDDLNGSRIIITTRELDVASYADSTSRPHVMNLMAVDQSWDLLKQKVFAQENCPPELEKIGRLVAENCRGLPLAIVVIAGVLSKVDQMQDAWINISENVIEALNSSDEQLSEILSLSYTHLPHHLRPCFLYMGGFPEDREINASKLIKLWAAEGFLRSNESNDVEELGDEYLEDLAKRSLVLINRKRYNSKIKTVKVHDLLRDLCLRKARNENFLCVINEFSGSFPEDIENSQRLSILSFVSGRIPNVDGSAIHTILFFDHWAFDSWKHFRLLRVVDAISVTFTWYPVKEISELVYLKYLAVTIETHAKSLDFDVPECFSKLQNLQTLIIRQTDFFEYGGIIYVPFGIWTMPQLRHLILLDGFLCGPSKDYCPEISALENLHTLARLKNFTCSERIVEMIPNLKKLGIFYSYKDMCETGWSEYGLNNLVHLHKLEKLSLYAEPYPNSKSDLSQNLAFPATLKKLTLCGCRFPWEDMTLVGSLPNLEVLKLKRRACYGTEWETIEGEFCQLKVLLIDSMNLHHWITESSHFPRLERLVLYDCNNLREIPYGIGEIPTLQLIEVDFRNLSIVESAKCIEEEQQSFGNELQVRLLKSCSWRR